MGPRVTSPNLHPGMVYIRKSAFYMGAKAGDETAEKEPDNIPTHKVHVSAFYLDTYEFTYGDYQRVTGIRVDPSLWHRPFTNVSWYQANDLCQRQGKRLPTEAEWEAAAGRYEFSTLDGTLLTDTGQKQANFNSEATVDVHRSGVNYLGIYGMTGNASEWVADWHSRNYYAETDGAKDPPGPAWGTKKVVRGGSFGMNGLIAPHLLRVTYRDYKAPSMADPYTGFRCAISSTE